MTASPKACPLPLEIGKEYLSHVSDGWNISGFPNCWMVYTTPIGWNGAGGYWIEERWTWKSGGEHSRSTKSLTLEESERLEQRIADLANPPALQRRIAMGGK